MSKPPTQIRLGPLPKIVLTKVTFACPDTLKADLDRYASLHAQVHGEPVNAVALIPYMLAAFLEQDRAFHSKRPGAGKSNERNPA
ncbi:MAG: DUF2274 domain-containing protein [Hyphomicrobiales bacterium]|nr:MAG: DUF2274 domain-containing protein [Hyphomicrobiales bacterium]